MTKEPKTPPPPPPAEALDTSKPLTRKTLAAHLSRAKILLERDDFSGALLHLEKVLAANPTHAQAKRLHEEAESELMFLFTSKLGDLQARPALLMSTDDMAWLNPDQRTSYVLSLIDGLSTYEEILAFSGLPMLEGLRILVRLAQDKVIG